MAAPSLRDNRDVASYFCTKHGHALKGKYKRIFSVGTHAITTYNPTTMEVTLFDQLILGI
jgi:DnaJ family protein C protein 13